MSRLRAVSPWRGAAVALASLGATLAGAGLVAAQDRTGGRDRGEVREGDPTVQGVVVDHDTGLPLPDAAVSLVRAGDRGPDPGSSPGPGDRLTDAAGRFAFPRVPAGTYLLRVALLGHEPLLDTLEVRPDSDLSVAVALSTRPIALEPVVVVARRRLDPLAREGFEFRRERLHGTFVTREEVEARNPALVSDLLRMVPGAVFVRDATGGYEMRLPRGTTLLGGPCRPPIYLDGVPLMGDLGMDSILPPESVQAVEVYTSAAETPPQFGSGACGAVVIWSRAYSGLDDGRPPPGPGWKRFVLLVGGLGLVFLVGR